MELLIVLVIIGFVVIAFGGAFGGAALFFKDEERAAGHEDAAVETCARLFTDGTHQVVYKAPDSSGGISTPTLVEQANKHGYELVQETGQMATRTVIFRRMPSGAP